MEKPEKYAVIQTGGKQYLVYEGKQLDVEKLSAKSTITFDKVLLTVNGEDVNVGQPYLEKAKVKAKILEQVRGPKIRGFKYTTGTQYRKRYGHRQELTRIEVAEIVV